MGTQEASIVTRQRRLVHLAANQEKQNADKVDITPVGMLSSEVITGEKPKLSMMMPLNVVSPPLGMLMAILKRNKIHVLGSMTASIA